MQYLDLLGISFTGLSDILNWNIFLAKEAFSKKLLYHEHSINRMNRKWSCLISLSSIWLYKQVCYRCLKRIDSVFLCNVTDFHFILARYTVTGLTRPTASGIAYCAFYFSIYTRHPLSLCVTLWLFVVFLLLRDRLIIKGYLNKDHIKVRAHESPLAKCVIYNRTPSVAVWQQIETCAKDETWIVLHLYRNTQAKRLAS